MPRIQKPVPAAIPGHEELPWTASAEVRVNDEGHTTTSLVQLDSPAEGLKLKTVNASLLMHKYAFGHLPKGKETKLFGEVFGVGSNDRLKEEGNYKRLALEGAVRASASLPITKAALRHLQGRQTLPDQLLTWNVSCPTRLFTGLGQKGIWETNVRIHPLWGFPVLDGSGLKGLARAWAQLSWLEETESGSARITDRGCLLRAKWAGAPDALKSISIVRALSVLLGHGAADPLDVDSKDERSGILTFHDAFPDSVPADGKYYAAEVINPHYGDYYGSSGDSSPSDRSEPSPTFHVAVREGLIFTFALSIDLSYWARLDRKDAPESTLNDWLALGQFCLTQALAELGFGSKRGTGYGFFSQRAPVITTPTDEPARAPQMADHFSSFPEAIRERARSVDAWTVNRFLTKKGERDQLAKALHGADPSALIPNTLVEYLKSIWSEDYSRLDKKSQREIRDWVKAHGVDWSAS